MLERENKDLKEQVYLLTEQLEELSVELQESKRSHHKTDKKFQPLNTNNPNEKIQKASALALFSLLNNNQQQKTRNVFDVMKFWIYKKSKLQEELEAKVSLT